MKNFSMKQSTLIIICCLLYGIITPAFHCGDPRPYDCGGSETDSTTMNLLVVNPAATFHVNDSIRIFSKISDTLNGPQGRKVTTDIPYLSLKINPFKVVMNGSLAQLNYATNEFNATVETGAFENYGGTGFQVLYQRLQPHNTLAATLIPGHTGLYLIQMGLGSYSYSEDANFYITTDPCTIYKGILTVPVASQQKHYWDSLSVSTLSLTSGGFVVADKRDKNYFFVNVIP